MVYGRMLAVEEKTRKGDPGSTREVHAASKTLWICRCAWTTLTRRPQLHRADLSKL